MCYLLHRRGPMDAGSSTSGSSGKIGDCGEIGSNKHFKMKESGGKKIAVSTQRGT